MSGISIKEIWDNFPGWLQILISGTGGGIIGELGTQFVNTLMWRILGSEPTLLFKGLIASAAILVAFDTLQKTRIEKVRDNLRQQINEIHEVLEARISPDGGQKPRSEIRTTRGMLAGALFGGTLGSFVGLGLAILGGIVGATLGRFLVDKDSHISLSSQEAPVGPTDLTKKWDTFSVESEIPIVTPTELIHRGAFSAEELAYLWLIIENQRNIIISGQGREKNITLRSLLLFFPPNKKMLSITDAPVSDEGLQREFYDNLQVALRESPNYISIENFHNNSEYVKPLVDAFETGVRVILTIRRDEVEEFVEYFEEKLEIITVVYQTPTRGPEEFPLTTHISEILFDEEDPPVQTDLFMFINYTQDRMQIGESNVLVDIKRQNNWNENQLEKELHQREVVLNSLSNENVDDIQHFQQAIKVFQEDREQLIEEINEGKVDYSNV